ncbi:MAG: class I SAM-dependent methyltransferase [Halobacteriota archaeon]
MDVELGSLEETLVVPLWHRAQATKANPELLNDPKAIELVNNVDYDFSTFEQHFTITDSLRSAARTRQFDDKLRAYISRHPCASIVNLGAGLDTAFYRVDNGSIAWHDLDLPDVIALRERLLPETNRVRYIAKSLFDTSWYGDIDRTDHGIFILARGVLWFFEEMEVKHFLSSLADALPGAELICDACSKLGAPIVTGSLWTVGMTDVEVKWVAGDAHVLSQWDSRLRLIDQTPVYSTPHDPASSENTVKNVDPSDQTYALSIVHLSV